VGVVLKVFNGLIAPLVRLHSCNKVLLGLDGVHALVVVVVELQVVVLVQNVLPPSQSGGEGGGGEKLYDLVVAYGLNEEEAHLFISSSRAQLLSSLDGGVRGIEDGDPPFATEARVEKQSRRRRRGGHTHQRSEATHTSSLVQPWQVAHDSQKPLFLQRNRRHRCPTSRPSSGKSRH
jgi:hypothetical protein